MNKDSGEPGRKDIVAYLLQVGNIARIQASQLLHANKEYESAIDVIGEKLLSFSENMISIVDICNSFLMHKDDYCVFNKIEYLISQNRQSREQFFGASGKIDEQLLGIQNSLVHLKNNFSQITEVVDNLISSLSFISESENTEEESKKELKRQAKELITGIRHAESHFKKFFHNMMLPSNNSVLNDKWQLRNNYYQKEYNRHNNSIAEFERGLLPLINREKETFSGIYMENVGYTFNLTEKVLNIIRSVRYYEYYDILADKVIQKLNYLSNSFHNEELSSTGKEFDKIRASYTMDSERKIHENSTGNAGEFELFEDLDRSDNDSNVELF
jgi:hypothetical protein